MLTHEEQRVAIYASDEVTTNPSKVTQDMPLESLNLNWTERDLPERLRTKHVHRMHPYLGKFIPQLVEVFLRKYFCAGQTVLDPFGGSGTTLVQANELGINSVAYDISAFNVLLMHAKTQKYDLEQVQEEILDIVDKVEYATAREIKQLAFWEKRYIGNYLKEWFAPQALEQLLKYRKLIHNYENRDILKVILCRSARSARQTTHFDLDFPKVPQIAPYWCYKHNRTCAPTTDALQFLKRYSLDTIRRLNEFASLRTDASVKIAHEDSRYANIPLIDGVITSPPYVGLIDYHEQHRYAYELLGLEDKSATEIGAAAQGSSQKAQRAYQESIAQVFQNCLTAMPSGGYLIVVAGDKYGLYKEIATMCDVQVEAILNRHVNRRTGRRSSEFYESVFVWRKR